MKKEKRKRRISFLSFVACFVLGAVLVVWYQQKNVPVYFDEPRKHRTEDRKEISEQSRLDIEGDQVQKAEKGLGKRDSQSGDMIESQSKETAMKGAPESTQTEKETEKQQPASAQVDTGKTADTIPLSEIMNPANVETELLKEVEKEVKQRVPDDISQERHAGQSYERDEGRQSSKGDTITTQNQRETQKERLEQVKEIFKLRMEAMKYLEGN